VKQPALNNFAIYPTDKIYQKVEQSALDAGSVTRKLINCTQQQL